jgi:hypothetical protein
MCNRGSIEVLCVETIARGGKSKTSQFTFQQTFPLQLPNISLYTSFFSAANKHCCKQKRVAKLTTLHIASYTNPFFLASL